MRGFRIRYAVKKIRAFRGYYATYNCNFLQTFRDNRSFPSSRVKKFGFMDPWRWDRYVVPKHSSGTTTIRRVIFQKRSDIRPFVLQYFPIFIELLVGHRTFIIPAFGRFPQNNPRIIATVFHRTRRSKFAYTKFHHSTQSSTFRNTFV